MKTGVLTYMASCLISFITTHNTFQAPYMYVYLYPYPYRFLYLCLEGCVKNTVLWGMVYARSCILLGSPKGLYS